MPRFEMKKLFLFFLPFLFLACSSSDKPYQLALDPSWPVVFPVQDRANFEAFMDELLREIANEIGISFEKISVPGFTLQQGLESGRYDLILSGINPGDLNLSKYNFSNMVLPLGPVVAYSSRVKIKDFKDFNNRIVAVAEASSALPLLEKANYAIIKTYAVAAEALEKLYSKDYDGVLLNNLIAAAYVNNRFSDLKITDPLSNEGIRFLVLNKRKALLKKIDKALAKLEKLGKLKELKKKWLMNL